MPQILTLFQQHCERWKDGCGAAICEFANKRVIGRGTLPCQVLFIGEAPGPSEDILGTPFIGPAGKLLDQIIKRSVPEHVTYYMTNLVCCIPRDPETGAKAMEPEDEDIHSCAPRLRELVAIADNQKRMKEEHGYEGSLRLIVCVGKLAKSMLEVGYKHRIKFHREIPQVHILHPAYILRVNVAQQGLLKQRCVVTLKNATEDL